MSSALHAEIFGDDLSDDDEDYAPPGEGQVEHASDGGEDADADADQILESAARNNLLLGAPKRERKKEKKEGGARSKRKASAGDEGNGSGKKRKRLQKPSRGEGAGESAGRPEEGEGGEVPAEGDDPDEDSMSGSEAVEEGGKNDIDKILTGLKAKRGGPSFSREKLKSDIKDLQERMEQAVENDDEAARAEKPALHKLAMLSDVETLMRKKQHHEIMIDEGMLSTLARWLRPMPDGSLVSLQVRKAILQALLRFEIDDTILGSLRSSGIGKYVKLLTLHKRELPENRRTALSLVEKWSRPIFQTSDKFHATDLPIAAGPVDLGSSSREEDEGAGQYSRTANHARVPRPMGMDFQMLPASKVTALPSSKYAKESTKGRLQDRILHGKKRATTQAVTLSVEGRTLDRI